MTVKLQCSDETQSEHLVSSNKPSLQFLRAIVFPHDSRNYPMRPTHRQLGLPSVYKLAFRLLHLLHSLEVAETFGESLQ